MPEVPQLRGWLVLKAQYWPVLVSTTTGSPGSTGLDGSSGLTRTKVMPLPLPLAVPGLTKPSRPVWGSTPSTCPLGLVTVTGVPGGRTGLVGPAGAGGCSGQQQRHMPGTQVLHLRLPSAVAWHGTQASCGQGQLRWQ